MEESYTLLKATKQKLLFFVHDTQLVKVWWATASQSTLGYLAQVVNVWWATASQSTLG